MFWCFLVLYRFKDSSNFKSVQVKYRRKLNRKNKSKELNLRKQAIHIQFDPSTGQQVQSGSVQLPPQKRRTIDKVRAFLGLHTGALGSEVEGQQQDDIVEDSDAKVTADVNTDDVIETDESVGIEQRTEGDDSKVQNDATEEIANGDGSPGKAMSTKPQEVYNSNTVQAPCKSTVVGDKTSVTSDANDTDTVPVGCHNDTGPANHLVQTSSNKEVSGGNDIPTSQTKMTKNEIEFDDDSDTDEILDTRTNFKTENRVWNNVHKTSDVDETTENLKVADDEDRADKVNIPKKKGKKANKGKIRKDPRIRDHPEISQDPDMFKYWAQRYRLFSRFDDGVKLDKGKCKEFTEILFPYKHLKSEDTVFN